MTKDQLNVSSAVTNFHAKEFTEICSILHFLDLPLENGKGLESEPFPNQDGIPKFKLRIFPRGFNDNTKNSVSMFLILASDSPANTTIQISILSKTMKLRPIIQPSPHSFQQRGVFRILNFIPRKTLIRYKSSLLPNETLRIVCGIRLSEYPVTVGCRLEEAFIGIDEKLQQISHYRERGILSDLTIIAGGDSTFRLPVHKSILAIRSPHIHGTLMRHQQLKMLDIGWTKVWTEELVNWMYTGKFQCLERDTRDAMVVADHFRLEELKYRCEEYLSRDLPVDKLFDMTMFALRHRAGGLLAECHKVLKENEDEIRKDKRWTTVKLELFKVLSGLEMLDV